MNLLLHITLFYLSIIFGALKWTCKYALFGLSASHLRVMRNKDEYDNNNNESFIQDPLLRAWNCWRKDVQMPLVFVRHIQTVGYILFISVFEQGKIKPLEHA